MLSREFPSDHFPERTVLYRLPELRQADAMEFVYVGKSLSVDFEGLNRASIGDG